MGSPGETTKKIINPLIINRYARGFLLFEAKAKAWYYAEILRDARKKEKVTQQQLADKIGKKREYIALEQGKTDMQLSTFLRISEALGLNFALV
jgi:Predicted transcriptional regulator with C-terminal CBS domains